VRDVVFHRLARREAGEASAWYSARSDRAQQRFRDAIFEAVDRISADPLVYAPLLGSYRFVRARRFPYALVYEVRPDATIFVVAVAHMSRRLGYWRQRK
jgi:plasmid stabilization system protein ParE